MDGHLMDKEVLCILDTRQIQRFMFRANSYVDTCGGSDLILHILGDAIRFALHHINTPLSEGEYDLANEADAPLPYFEDPNVQFQQIINTSGNAIFVARTGALAQKVIRKISRYYLDHGYSLNGTEIATLHLRRHRLRDARHRLPCGLPSGGGMLQKRQSYSEEDVQSARRLCRELCEVCIKNLAS